MGVGTRSALGFWVLVFAAMLLTHYELTGIVSSAMAISKKWREEVLEHADVRRDVRVVFMLSEDEIQALDQAVKEIGLARRGEAIRAFLRKAGALK